VKSEAPPDLGMIEIIDIIDDGVDPSGERSHNTTIHDNGGPRWVGPTAAAALVALIGYGIATSASSNSVPRVAQAPTTTVRTVTSLAAPPPTTEPAPVVPYYSAAPPREYRVQFAEVQTAETNRFSPGKYQLWAMPGATATSGSWFSIESFRTGPQPIYAVDAFRVATDDRPMAISHMESGQSTIQFSVDDVMSVTITAFGWADEDLVRLAQSVTRNEPSLAGDNVMPSDPTLIDDFQLLSTVQPYQAAFGDAVEQVYYGMGTDPSRGFSINVAHLDPRKGDAGLAARRTALRFFVDRPTPFEVDGHSGVVGAMIGQPDSTVATWIAGDHIVALVGTLTVAEMITVARTVHEVSSDEWAGMRFQASRNNNGFSGDYTQTDPRPASYGTDAEGGQWVVSVSTSTFAGDQHSVDWQWRDGGGYGSLTDDTAKITTVVDGERTYVLAELPRAIAPAAQLQVTRTGFEPILAPFTDTDATLDRTFAAFAFSEPTTYTAQIIGTDGTVLATWPSS
jgi:hypothetical protein